MIHLQTVICHPVHVLPALWVGFLLPDDLLVTRGTLCQGYRVIPFALKGVDQGIVV